MPESAELWMVVGLGNPGPRYQRNRHNVGFMVVDDLARRGEDLQWRPEVRFDAELARGRLQRQQVVLVKPQTYMNLSGRAVGPLSQFYNIPPEQVVAVHDDVDLDPGRVKVKVGGGDGGHKGLRSLTEDLGSQQFVRVRLGIGRPERGEVTDFVLQDFPPAELEQVEQQVVQAGDAVTTVIESGPGVAMNRFNARLDRDNNEDEDNRDTDTREHAGPTAH